jgi:hypothetical protein
MGNWDSEQYQGLVREAYVKLQEAQALLDGEVPTGWDEVAQGYTLGRLDVALEILETELPEFQAVQHLNLLNALKGE